MPEGPEIRRAADQIAAVMLEQPLDKVWFEFSHLKVFQRKLVGCTITRIDTRGKAMLTRFSNGLTLYSHNQLYGRWHVTAGDTPKVTRSLRVELRHKKGAAFLYSATDVDILTNAELAEHPFLLRLGPDVLEASIDEVEQALLSNKHAGRALGGLYLDQRFIAGLGNYLRSEILFYAAVHPSKKPRHLEAKQARKLARLTREISRRSYRTGGVTLSPSHAKALRSGLRFERRRFAVFGREGKACYTCNSKIERISVASRRLYFCPSCQTT